MTLPRTTLSTRSFASAKSAGVCRVGILALALALTGLAPAALADAEGFADGAFAVCAAKVLVCEEEGLAAIDQGVLLVRDGRIVAVGGVDEIAIPADHEIIDVGDSWLMPGMIDLHSHVGGSGGLNDMVFQVNPGLRVGTSVVTGNANLVRPLAAGITSILYIPGSGTNIGGQGVLMKTHETEFEDAVIRNPGSLKIAQGDNPKRWGYRMNRALMNHHIRYALRQGKAYAMRWQEYEEGRASIPARHINLDVFRDLYNNEIAISTHTQYFQVVLATMRILRIEFGFPTFIDHGSFDSWLLGELAEEIGVPAILGPREVMFPRPGRFDTDGRVEGSAWGFQKMGVTKIGFNTDAPVLPQEELPLQSAMGVRYGFDNSTMDAVRGLTIVPAVVAGIGDELGSLEPGKLADLVVLTGDPSDPRTTVERVWIRGETVYEVSEEVRLW